MNSFWHFLILHGFKLAIIAIALGGRLYRWQARRSAASRPKMPPQSAPSAPPIGAPKNQQPVKNAPPKNATRPLKKDDGSPWSSNDPFN